MSSLKLPLRRVLRIASRIPWNVGGVLGVRTYEKVERGKRATTPTDRRPTDLLPTAADRPTDRPVTGGRSAGRPTADRPPASPPPARPPASPTDRPQAILDRIYAMLLP